MEDSAPTDLTGVILDGRYRIIEAIAEGAMGIVYRAERVKLGRIVAIKLMHDSLPSELSSRQRFEIEAMAMAKLEHPHCAAVLDVGLHDGKPYVVMDFVSGDNLKDLLENRAIPIVRVVEIMRQVLSGLAHAHELGIIHRDIKPANIVLSQKAGLGDHVKILDFGLARLNDTAGPALTVGLVVGTPSYMAPEQCIGQLVDARTDLYACGVMLFELLTGKKPFVSNNDDPVEVVRMHIQQRPPTLAEATGQEFGPELEGIVARALAKAPADRYASATDFSAELDVIRARLFSAPIAVQSVPDNTSTASGWASPSDPVDPSLLPVSSSQFVHVEASSSGVPPVDPSLAAVSVSPSQILDTTGVPHTSQAAPVATHTPPAGVPIATGNTFFGVPVGPQTPARGVALVQTPTAGVPVTQTSAGVMPYRQTPAAGVPVAPQYPRGATEGAAMSFPPPPPLAIAPVRPIPWLPLDRKQLRIAAVAGGVLLLIIIIAVAASGGAPKVAVVADAGRQEIVMDDAGTVLPAADPEAELIARARKLMGQGKRDAALDLLDKGHAVFPNNATISYLAGNIYFAKLFWTAGIKSYRDAIRLEPAYKSDPELIKTALRGFLVTPSYSSEIATFLRNDIGPAAASFLEETARSHPTKGIRDRAAAELKRYQ